MLVMMVTLISAPLQEETYQVGDTVNLIFTCTVDGQPYGDAGYNISIYRPDGTNISENVATTEIRAGEFNYSTSFSTLGRYKIVSNCYDSDGNYSNTDFVQVVSYGGGVDKDFGAIDFIIGLALIICLFVFIKISKFFGSLMLMILGFGMLFQYSDSGWIGWIIIGCGFIAVIYSLISRPKRFRRRFK